jgi:hypothetical protein
LPWSAWLLIAGHHRSRSAGEHPGCYSGVSRRRRRFTSGHARCRGAGSGCYRVTVPKLAGINHQQAVQVLEKAGFRIVRQGKHIVLTDRVCILTIPRRNAINATTIWGIMRDAGLPIPVTPNPRLGRYSLSSDDNIDATDFGPSELAANFL